MASRLKGAAKGFHDQIDDYLGEMIGPRLNWASLSKPLMGRLISITRLRSASNGTASFTGRLLARERSLAATAKNERA